MANMIPVDNDGVAPNVEGYAGATRTTISGNIVRAAISYKF